MEKLGWGKAKREVLSLKVEILKKIEDGMNLSEIYSELHSSGKISLGFSTFHRHASNLASASKKSSVPQPKNTGLPSVERKSSETPPADETKSKFIQPQLFSGRNYNPHISEERTKSFWNGPSEKEGNDE